MNARSVVQLAASTLLLVACPARAEAPASAAVADETSPSTLNLGLALMVTAEPGDGTTDVAINVVPVTVEWAATDWVGVRVRTLLNAQIAGAARGLAQRGGGATVPIYLSRDSGAGWYAGPYFGFAQNPLVDGTDTTLAGEGGIRWRFAESWLLNVELQLGTTHLTGNDDPRWVMHFGVYPSVGVWLL